MKILVCGGRDYSDYETVEAVLGGIYVDFWSPQEFIIVHGAAPGADSLAAKWCELGYGVSKPYPADWDKHGKSAGPKRNQQMFDENPDIELVVAFRGGRGTADTIRRARLKRLHVEEIP